MRLIWFVGKMILAVVLIIIAVDAGLVLLFGRWRPDISQADAVIVMGAAINTPALQQRSLAGLGLYEQGKASVLMLSGGRISDKDISEARYMDKVIRAHTAIAPPVILDEQSHSTYENLKDSRNKLGDKRRVIIVSDEFHLARTVLLAYRLGFRPVQWTAPAPTYYSKPELRRYYYREFFAMIGYIPRFIFG